MRCIHMLGIIVPASRVPHAPTAKPLRQASQSARGRGGSRRVYRVTAFCCCMAAAGCAQLGYQAPPWDRTPTNLGGHLW